jgi:GNAT superfamily N-acetyltransferase
MLKNNLLEQVCKIEEIELALTIFNSKRALSQIDKSLELKKIGMCNLLIDSNSPNSIYYNRIKGFGVKDINKIEDILGCYYEKGLTPCFDMTPNNINEEVAVELSKRGFINSEQLVFLQSASQVDKDLKHNIRIVKVTEESAREFVNIVVSTNNGVDISEEVIERKKHYFYRLDFHNYIVYIGEKVAGIGSLFTRGNEGYIANDYTFPEFRGKGVQTALLTQRIREAKEMGIINLYTDVEFGSISHNNMEKLGFKTIFINSFWIKTK